MRVGWLVIGLFLSSQVSATELVHHFANPNFIGGDPNKGAVLLNEANAQNGYKAPVAVTTPKVTQTPLQQYATKVQTALLSAVTTAQVKTIKESILDTNGTIKSNVDVSLGGGYTLTTSDPITNDDGSITMSMTISDGISNTTFTVPYLTQ